MKFKTCLLLSSFILVAVPLLRAAAPPQKDYLTAVEADKIRDAEKDTNERIRLFLSFAEDRWKNSSTIGASLDEPPRRYAEFTSERLRWVCR